MGNPKKYKKGTRLADVVETKDAVAAIVNGAVKDLSDVLPEDSKVRFITFDEDVGKEIYWHSTSHILAFAVKRLYPNAKLAIGPAISEGFYYDFEVEKPFTPEDIKEIEKEMKSIIDADYPFIKESLNKEDASKLFKDLGEDYKVELLQEIEGQVTVYKNDGFVDLCRGPHLLNTGRVKNFKLLSSSGAYWKGDESREILQRIYGISFEKKEDLISYLKRLEEAKKRDHRVLGSQLGLWMMDDEIGPGLVVWLPRGMTVRKIIEDFWWNEHTKRGYEFILSPHLARSDLWKKSGHLDYYRDLNYPIMEKENQGYLVKPMNCPFHIMVYKQKRRSYRELPMRLAELGTVYRYEKSGVLHGLLRVRGFTQDDGHLFCSREQSRDELISTIELAKSMFASFGFKEYKVDLSLWDKNDKDKYMGAEEDWHNAEESLVEALKSTDLPFQKKEGEAAFYGPKIDIKILDSLNREWQATTIQYDFNLPSRFDLKFIGKDGNHHNVLLIHRAILGSVERFMGTLVEHYGGKFPLWLAPLQVKILPITSTVNDYAEHLNDEITSSSIRTDVDYRNEKLSLKIREATLEKVPYMVIIGGKEESSGSISVRSRDQGNIGSMGMQDFIKLLLKEIKEKRSSVS